MKYLIFLSMIACGTPVQGKWEALDTSINGLKYDVTQDFTDRTIMTKTVGYSGSTPQYTTIFSGTYTWENQSDGTHVFAVYSSANITGPQGEIDYIDPAVCLQLQNCEGIQFQLSSAQESSCICKIQELVFDVDGDSMTGIFGDTTITYRRPQ